MPLNMPLICDYTDTDYKHNFWEQSDRVYEDKAERQALKKLLPERGKAILDLGAGYGRLTDEYVDHFEEVVLFDFAANLLKQAEQDWCVRQNKQHIRCIQGDAHALPFTDKSFDTVLCVRLMHHVLDIETVFTEIKRVLKPQGHAVVEFANKRNAKEIIRFLFGKSGTSPFSLEPYQRGEGVFYNFHPDYVRNLLWQQGLKIEKQLSVSNFRMHFLKKRIALEKLLAWEDRMQEPLAALYFGPSLFLKIKRL